MAESPTVGALVWERLDPLPPTELDDRHRRGGTVVAIDHAGETVTLATTRLEHRGKRQARVIETTQLPLEAIDVDMTTPATSRWPDRYRLARDLLEAIAQRRASRTGQPDDFDHTALDWARQLWAPTPAPGQLSERAADALGEFMVADLELRGHLPPEVVTDDKGRPLGSITRPSRPPAGTTAAPPTPPATADPAGALEGRPPVTREERHRAAIDRALAPALERLRAQP